MRKKIFVFGDSHARVFKTKYLKGLLFPFRFQVCSVGGATAQGLRNPKSKTNAVEVFKKKISLLSPKDTVVVQLGEVDTGFVIWYRAKKYGESVEIQLQNSISAYSEFLKWIKSRGLSNIIVLSAPLPTISDDNSNGGEVADARKAINVSQVERTKLTLEYNKKIGNICDGLGIQFLDCDHKLYNRETGVIKSKFLNKDNSNHHLDNLQYSLVLAGSFYKFLIGKENQSCA